MKKRMLSILLLMLFAMISRAQQTDFIQIKDRQLFQYSTEKKYQPTHKLIAEQYKICPPLRPERFRRKVKMLWGIDVNDYPENSVIIFNNAFFLSKKYQLIQGGKLGFWVPDEIDEIPLAPPLPDSIYSSGRKFLFFNDTSVYKQLKEYKYTYTEKVLKMNEFYLDYKHDFLDSYDLLAQSYRTIVMPPVSLLNYIDKNKPDADYFGSVTLNNIVNINPLVSKRIFDMRSDLLLLYAKSQSSSRKLTISNFNNKREKTDILVSIDGTGLLFYPKRYADYFDMHFPWHNYNLIRSFTGSLSFLVQLQQKEANSLIIKYMSGQVDASDTQSYMGKTKQDSIRHLIRSNNYYGYAILREFCENPEREMPTLEKIGTSFNAKVIPPKTLLYLEPYPDSYDIDTISSSEIFKAYEMGYDDYYFVEVIKPVESPVAGPDGYAMILDRTETVYGYIRKSEVQEIPEAEIEHQKIMSQLGERKLGLIDDPDGYVNIRKAISAESEIIGKIVEKELFFYWEIADSNWWYVEAKDTAKGFVHKSRIKEKIDAGGWIIDE